MDCRRSKVFRLILRKLFRLKAYHCLLSVVICWPITPIQCNLFYCFNLNWSNYFRNGQEIKSSWEAFGQRVIYDPSQWTASITKIVIGLKLKQRELTYRQLFLLFIEIKLFTVMIAGQPNCMNFATFINLSREKQYDRCMATRLIVPGCPYDGSIKWNFVEQFSESWAQPTHLSCVFKKFRPVHFLITKAPVVEQVIRLFYFVRYIEFPKTAHWQAISGLSYESQWRHSVVHRELK